LKSTAKYSAMIVACGQHSHRDAEVDDHRAIFWVVENGGTPLSLTFVREGHSWLMATGWGTQVAKPSRGTVGLRELLGAKDGGPTADRRPQEEYATVVAVAVDGS
jgi:hypothetical protein